MNPVFDFRLFLGKDVLVRIDRPKGSKHPTCPDLCYTVNYGYVPDTISGDGEELDAYILGIDTPLKEFKGICIAVIHRTDDDDDKLVIAPSGMNFTDEEIRAQTNFQEQYFKSVIWRK
ncbi:MAG: inorganic diphosphatase [Candidatus Woesearchaeota archaeon]